MAIVDKSYHQLLYAIMQHGYEYETENRPGIVCKQLSSVNMEIPLYKEFPLITTKQMFTKGIVGELIWFLRGMSNIEYLNDNGIHIWDKDANTFSDDGEVGRNYGVQWRHWTGVNIINPVNHELETYSFDVYEFDQILNLIINLRKPNPINRRHIVTSWNPAELDDTALPPCHWSFEIIVRPLLTLEQDETVRYGLYLKWNQRSVDTFLGLPFNIASYALLAHIIGLLTNIKPLGLIGNLSNVHIYEPHFEVVEEQFSRNPEEYSGCQLEIAENKLGHTEDFNDIDSIFDNLQISDFKFNNYESYPALKAEMFEQIKTK